MKQANNDGSYLVGLAAGLLAAGVGYLLVGTKRGNQFREHMLTEWQRVHQDDPTEGKQDLQKIESAFSQIVKSVFPQLIKPPAKKSGRARKSSGATFKGV